MSEIDDIPKDASNTDKDKQQDTPNEPEVVKFTPEEEAALLKESHDIKAEANTLFNAKDYENAISRYEDAIHSCPNYLHYERAVLQSNIAACHLKLEEWKEAIKTATNAIDSLAKLEPKQPDENDAKDESSESKDGKKPAKSKDDDDEVEEEIVSSGAAKSAPAPTPELSAAETRRADIIRIRTKALLRRARARSEAGGWQNLAGAEEDYRALSQMPGLTPGDLRTVRTQLVSLPPRTKAAQEAEMAEMWGKLKDGQG
ncbi:hypothetical protein PT974_02310 [Cladobotryum mycophilum]|uniref:Tetratricopeptide repeat protein 1 n=1 Tax=Cladobotryum mycophilum TaxID=491253 RepID=A0ABR0SYL0_9HYPO